MNHYQRLSTINVIGVSGKAETKKTGQEKYLKTDKQTSSHRSSQQDRSEGKAGTERSNY